MAIFVAKSIHIQISGQVYGFINIHALAFVKLQYML